MALSNIVAFAGYAIKLLPVLLELMGFVEKTIKTGELRKPAATSLLKSFVMTSKDVSTGGAKESWERIEEPLTAKGGVIDSMATIFFGSKEVIDFDENE